MRPRSLAGRLLLAASAGLLAAAVAAIALLWVSPWPRTGEDVLRVELEEEWQHLRDGLRVAADGTAQLRLDAKNTAAYDAMPKDAAYLVLDAAGRDVLSSPPGPALDALRGMSPEVTIQSGEVAGGGGELLMMGGQIHHGGRAYTARVARSDRLVSTLGDYAGELYVRAGLITVLIALLTFGGVVFFTVRRLLRPLHRASAIASAIGPRNLAARLQVEQMPSELKPMVQAFNAALDRLENGYRVQQEFLASAAHELKTPLALLQAEIELGGAANTEVLLRDTALMARQVHQLLHLAEVSEGHNYRFAPMAMGDAVQEAADYLARAADRKAVHVDVEVAPSLAPVEADAAAVFVLAKNLLENALNHSSPGGVIRVRVEASGFSVQDEGPGVPEADLPHLFQRFWRAQRDGHGAGLGLAICQEVCAAHGWRIRLATHDEGACFVVAIA
ncbi:hypothetical protein ARC20_05995 [Stenotrophomonas panacihumi]|uniref:histidine kinase n=1 Tax=Stenotrophomonas panacihumi TaxID=676599 RepID=A0A0R0ALI9_9GAMM|nr:ATP-binding protein [Stenotrophomonas panacihumi]KRG45957.1 hypothetical protein ARC20_05995 [Stenotrophomonas panacihumi]PTN56323.1 sensor histidine kinase [Stenotrophomonas panacihumi]